MKIINQEIKYILMALGIIILGMLLYFSLPIIPLFEGCAFASPMFFIGFPYLYLNQKRKSTSINPLPLI
jgi:hypothetical protein